MAEDKTWRYLILQSVGAVELQNDMIDKGVFDTLDHVLSLCFCQLHCIRGLKQSTQTGELWYGRQLFRIDLLTTSPNLTTWFHKKTTSKNWDYWGIKLV